MNDDGAVLHDRRESDVYYVLSEPQIKRLVEDAAKAGGAHAVDSLTALVGKSVIRKAMALAGAAMVVATAWLTDMIHFGVPK